MGHTTGSVHPKKLDGRIPRTQWIPMDSIDRTTCSGIQGMRKMDLLLPESGLYKHVAGRDFKICYPKWKDEQGKW